METTILLYPDKAAQETIVHGSESSHMTTLRPAGTEAELGGLVGNTFTSDVKAKKMETRTPASRRQSEPHRVSQPVGSTNPGR